MNIKALSFIKNMSYTIFSNFVSLIASALVILIIPKLIGVEEYGYWQLYLFYSSYVGFLHFGWNDGIYLRFGGEDYNNLDKKIFFSQFVQLLFFQLLIGSTIYGLSNVFMSDVNRAFIYQMVALSMVLVNLRIMFLYILQATNRIREYAWITMFDRIVYIFLIALFLTLGVRNYQLMIIADLIGKFFSLIMTVCFCKDIVFNKVSDFFFTINEAVANISIGIKLMFANIASLLIIGIVRFGIERTWDVATFGKVSLTLSISNMMMIFINAVGIVMYPLLRRTAHEKLSTIYSTMRDFLMPILLGFLLVYFPMKIILSAWLPQYEESLLYMALVFPMFIYEGKMALLISTYLKTLRRENTMLRINLISMIISLAMTYMATQIFKNLDLAIVNIVILLALRSALAETYISKELKVSVKKDIFLELSLALVFILTGWYINSWMATVGYAIAFGIYLFIKRKDLKDAASNIKILLKE